MLNLMIRAIQPSQSLLTFWLALAISGCTVQPDTSKIEQRLNEVQKFPQSRLKELPKIPEQLKLSYTHAELRDPFLPSRSVTNLIAEVSEPLEPLEKYSIDQLSFRGVMQKGQQTYALIITPDNQLYRVTQGSKLGNNKGVIIHLDLHSITLKEYITQGSQLLEQEKRINTSNK